jgi:hypothetical protein
LQWKETPRVISDYSYEEYGLPGCTAMYVRDPDLCERRRVPTFKVKELATAHFFLGLLFEHEDGGDVFPPKCQPASEPHGVTTHCRENLRYNVQIMILPLYI